MEHCKFRVMDKCKNEECELLMCMGAEKCIHFEAEVKEELEDFIPKRKVKKAINEICKISPVATTIGNTIPVMKNCDDIKLEVVAILNRLIAESED